MPANAMEMMYAYVVYTRNNWELCPKFEPAWALSMAAAAWALRWAALASIAATLGREHPGLSRTGRRRYGRSHPPLPQLLAETRWEDPPLTQPPASLTHGKDPSFLTRAGGFGG